MRNAWPGLLRAHLCVAQTLRWGRLAHSLWREMVASGPSYPLFRRELTYWQQSPAGRWRVDELFAMLALINLCLMPATLLIFPKLLLAQAVLDELLGLCIVVPAATLVVRERDQQSWQVLRATTLTSAQIVGGKVTGLLHMAWSGAHYIAGARLLGTLLALPLLAILFVLPGQLPVVVGRAVGPWIGALALAYAASVYRPQVNLFHGSCLGLLASTAATSTRRAVVAAIMVHGLLSVVSATLVLALARSAYLDTWFNTNVLGEHLRQIYVWLLPLGLVALVRLVMAPACLLLAVLRVDRWLD